MGRWWAALLAAGEESALSHLSAGQLFAVIRFPPEAIHVSIPAASVRRAPGLVLHRRADVQTTTHRGIRTTTIAETLVDLAATFAPDPLERAVNEADAHGLVDPERLRAHLDEIPSRRGIRSLRKLLDRHTFRLTDSDLEQRMLRIALSTGLPLPETRDRGHGRRKDFFWPDLGLIVETDGLTYHRTPAQQADDRRRDQLHAAAGLETLRFTDHQVRYESHHVQSILGAVAERRLKGWPGSRRAKPSVDERSPHP